MRLEKKNMNKIGIAKLVAKISFLLLMGRSAYAATYYISPSGNDTSGNGSSASPWKTSTKAFAQGGGHTYIFKDGTYNYAGGAIQNPPSGTAGAYTYIKAENDGAVILKGYSEAIQVENKSYIQIEGVTIKDGASSQAIAICDSNHIKVMRVGVKNGAPWNDRYADVVVLSSRDGVTGTKDCLLEDVWVVGVMRYGILIGGSAAYSERNILRRCVVRFDGSNSVEPHAGISNYGETSGVQGARNNIIQNCITIDFNSADNASGEGIYAGFYNPHNAVNIDFYGCIALKTKEAGWILNEDANSNGNDMYNCVVWAPSGFGITGQRGTTPSSVISQVTVGLAAQDAYASFNGARADISNSLFYNNTGGINSATSVNYSQFWNDPASGSNALTSNPLTLYIPRVESNSPGYQSGSGGLSRGATIVKKYGVSGTLHGETGYNTLTNEDLWPFPYQDRIHDLFAEADGNSNMPSNNEARGFAAAGQTLTNYIWNYLGNGNPFPSVADTVSPSVSITAPANNATVLGNVTVTANASDNVGVTKVEFIINGSVRATDTSAPFTYDWDTLLELNGVFGIQAKAYDSAGNTNTSAIGVTLANVLDILPPTVSITAPTDGSTVSGTYSVAASASDLVGVTRVQFLVDGVVVSTDTTSPYSYSWNTSALGNGSHSVAARAYDAANNSATDTSNVTVSNADTTNPTVTLSAPANAATVNGTVSLTATASDNIGVTRVQFLADGAVISTDTTSPYTGSWNSTAVSNGAHTLAARAFDAAGNSVTDTNNVTVSNPDTTDPTVSITAPANGATISGNTAVSVTAADNVGVTKVEFYVDGSLDSTDTTSPYSYTWNTNNDLNGSHTLIARAYDAANNTADATLNVTVSNADVTPPTISITAPANGATVSGIVNVTGTATDNLSVARVEFSVDGVVKSTDVSSPYSYNWDTASETNGSHAILLRAFDAAGNSASASRNVTVSNTVPDTTNPSVSITAPIDGATVSGTVSVTATASDNVGVNRVQFLVDGVVKSTDSTSPYSYSWNTASESNAAHSVTVRAFDAAGNSATDTNNVTVSNTVPDTTNPTISITAPANNATVSGAVNVTVNAADNVGVSRVQFSIDGVVVSTDTVSPFSYNWNTASESNASHSITVRAFDAAGNNASATRNVTVSNTTPDTTNPSVSITAPANGATVSGTQSVTASASDNVGVNRVQFLVDGVVVSTDTTSPYTYNWNTTGASNGSHSLAARAYDAAGNSAASGFISVTVSNATPDTTNPTVSVTAPANGATVSGTVSVTAAASDNVGVNRVEFSVDGSLQATDTTSPYSFSWNTVSESNGAHSVSARAYDAAGNNVNASVSVTVSNAPAGDTTAPSLTLNSPSNNTKVQGTVSVTATASDNVGVSRVEFLVDGSVRATDTAAPYTYSWNTKSSFYGNHTVAARAYDAAGNMTSRSATVIKYYTWFRGVRSVSSTSGSASFSSPLSGAPAQAGSSVLITVTSDDPVFSPNPISATLRLPSGDKDVVLSKAPGNSNVCYIEVPESTISLAEIQSLSGQELSIMVGAEEVIADVESNTLSPEFGGTITETTGGGAQVIFAPNSFSMPAQVTILPEPSDGTQARNDALIAANLLSMGSGREISFVSSGTLTSATVVLPFNSTLLPEGYSANQVQIAYYNPTSGAWELQASPSVAGNTVQTSVTHFSLYKPVLPVADAAALGLNESYVFPNPAVAPDEPTVRASLGVVSEISLKIFDLGGQMVHEASVAPNPAGYSNGQPYYDYLWSGPKANGMYLALVEGRKLDGGTSRTRVRFAVVR